MFITNQKNNIPRSFQILEQNIHLKDFADSVLKKQIGNQLNWIGTYSILDDMDFVRNKNFLTDPGIEKDFLFTYKGKKYENGRCQYIINFKIKDSRKANSEGSIFIDSASYALQGLTYFLNDKAREKMNKKNHSKDFFGFYQVYYQIADNNKWNIRNIHIEAHAYKDLNHRKFQTKLYLDFATLKINDGNEIINLPSKKNLILIRKNGKEIIPEKLSYPNITNEKTLMEKVKNYITTK